MLYVFKQAKINTRNYYRYAGKCNQPVAFGQAKNVFTSKMLADLLRTRLVDIPAAPPTIMWNTNPHLAVQMRTDHTPALPELKVWRSEFLLRSNNAKRWKERDKGYIVVSPMTRSSFAIHEAYDFSKATVVGIHECDVNLAPGSVPTMCKTSAGLPRYGLAEGFGLYLEPFPNNTVLVRSTDTLPVKFNLIKDSTGITKVPSITSQNTVDGLHTAIREAVINRDPPPGLVTQVVAAARSGTYDLLTDIAEAKSTFQTIASCILRILRMYTDTRRRTAELGRMINRRGGSSKVLDDLTQKYNNQWLEFRYGITPIVLSINSAIEWHNKREHEFAKFRGLRTDQISINVAGLELEVPVTYRVFGKVRVDGATAGLKLNPLTTALELVPLSLLLNWVCNIGDCLSAIWPPSGATQEVYTLSVQVPKGLYPAVYNGIEVNVEFGLYDCKVINNPLDHIEFVAGLNIGWKRMVDAFALAYMPVKKRLSSPNR